MSTNLLKPNGIKLIPKSPKKIQSKQIYTNVLLRKNIRNLSPLSSYPISKKSSKKNVNNTSPNKYHFRKKGRRTASQIYNSSLQNASEKEEEETKKARKKNSVLNRSTTSKRYKPLSLKSKFDSYNDMDKLSFERFKKYNSIFEEIKRQIYDINQAYKSLGQTCNIYNSSNNLNNENINNNNASINKDIINLNNKVNKKENEEKENYSPNTNILEEKEILENKVNINQNNDINVIQPSKHENSISKNINTSEKSLIKKISLDEFTINKKIYTIETQSNNNYLNYNNNIDKKLIKNLFEKTNIDSITFINNRNEFNNQIYLKNKSKLKISNGTNFFYEGQTNCRCEYCFIF